MSTEAKIRFEKSRKRLSEVLRNLEEVVKDKIHETAIDSKMIDVSDDLSSSAQAKVIEQEAVIQNLNEEINKLQKNLSDLGNENEFLNDKSKILGKKFDELRNTGRNLLDAIDVELAAIEEAINDN